MRSRRSRKRRAPSSRAMCWTCATIRAVCSTKRFPWSTPSPTRVRSSRSRQAKLEAIQQRMGFREENLRRSITNPNPGDKPVDKPSDKSSETKPTDKKEDKPAAATPGAQPSGDPDEPPKDAVADYQLLRAVDLIRGISLYTSRAN